MHSYSFAYMYNFSFGTRPPEQEFAILRAMTDQYILFAHIIKKTFM